MDDKHRIRTLWDLIGREVSHVRGGAGRLSHAYDETWHFRISWEADVDDYPSIVPVGVLLLLGMPMQEFLRVHAPQVLQAEESWKTFSFVSRSANPQQFMDADWARVNELLRAGRIDQANKAYAETCAYFLPTEVYEPAVAEAKLKHERDSHRGKILTLLANKNINGAQQHFEAYCRDWWELGDFQRKVDTVHREILRLQAVERERQRVVAEKRELDRQFRLRRKVLELLRQGRISLANAAYNECTDFWPLDAYTREREISLQAHRSEVQRRWDERRRSRQAAFRRRVAGLLQDLDIEGADKFYEHGKACWIMSEYEALRAEAIRKQQFVHEYSGASLSRLDDLYHASFADKLLGSDYARLKLPKLRLRLSRLALPLDEEQLLACALPERYRLIRARAGSGKTRTLAALAALTIHDEALDPDKVLILAFNKKAANEIGDRVRGAAGVEEFRNARTFHSLAWQLADHAGRELIFDDGNLAPSRRKQTGFVERLIGSIMNPAFRERLYEFFRRELEQLDRLGSNLSKEEYVALRRSIADYTLGGETVKSNGEKFIADFLFEHGIAYKYEKVWSWDKQDRLHGTAYRPDFSIIDGGRNFVLEHWAIDPEDGSAQVPPWWRTTTEVYRDQIEAKREFWKNRGVALLETHTAMLTGGREAFETSLQTLLERAGIRCRKLGHDELVQRVAEAPRTVSRMAELFMQFISRAKKRGWKADDIARIVRDTPDLEPRNRAFHDLAVHAYAAYERKLVEQAAMDFDDLLISAAECVGKHGGAARLQLDKSESIAIHNLRWILIDEFQDFSELYYRLINAILEANPSIRVVAVGDDWQAINGFAGAQLAFFNRFDEYFSGAGEAVISTNRRSGRAIVGAGNELMEGRGDPALAHKSFDGDIDVVAIDKTWPEDGSAYLLAATRVHDDGRRSVNYELAKALKACADYIAQSVYMDALGSRWMPSVLILARTGRAYGAKLAEFGRQLEQVLHSHPDLRDLENDFLVGKTAESDMADGSAIIDVMTAHKAKGKEADTVIVLEAVLRQFPMVHADNQLFGPFGVTAEDVLAEERRLFYVAATRAKRRLMLLTETGNESPYVGSVTRRHPAGNRSGGMGRQLGAEAQALKVHLDRIDRESLIRKNVSQHAVLAWDRMVGQSLGPPEVGYSLSPDMHAELAWPERTRPIAILTGRQRSLASRWRAMGWDVH